MKTRFKDKNCNYIYEGDILYVEEYPEKYVGGSLSFEGIVTIENGRATVTYCDIGECESFPLSMFPRKGREILSEQARYEYFKSMLLGAEPDAVLYKEELYRRRFDA